MLRVALLGFAVLFLCGFSVECNAWHHEPDEAAEVAEAFAFAAFVNDAPAEALTMASLHDGETFTATQLAEVLRQIHPAGHPTSVRATDYQPTPGYRGMQVFLEGQSADGERFYYRFLMEGTADEGYKVREFYRGTGPYPTGVERKPLTTR